MNLILAFLLLSMGQGNKAWRSGTLISPLIWASVQIGMYYCYIAEIGDVRRFVRKQSPVAFAGIDPAPNDSGDKYGRNSGTTKRGSPYLRKTLFNIMKCYIQNAPDDEPIYQFIDKKRSEGKPYFVYMTAAANKFLRRYYAKVNEYLLSSENTIS